MPRWLSSRVYVATLSTRPIAAKVVLSQINDFHTRVDSNVAGQCFPKEVKEGARAVLIRVAGAV